MRIDLHSHSTASDGRLTPAELVRRAVAQRVDVLALTDHDTVAGLPEAAGTIAAENLPLRLIDGIELSTSWDALEIHVVGLHIDASSPELLAAISRQESARQARGVELGHRLAKQRIDNAYEGALALANGASLTRAHFARYLVEAGHCNTQQKAFDHYIGRGGKAYVPHQWMSIAEAIQVIHASGGLAVLAHPGRYKLSTKWLKRLLLLFKESGGDAMEVSLPQQSPQDRANLGLWCREHQLLASVGSDFHAPTSWQELGRNLWLPKDVTPVWHTFIDSNES
ncbi:MAG: PHP domain-containing protein [Aeromonadaceae bacterium]|jgi:predicted metal-dependent phosphoesterase TrpH|nr:PHP domain-containing protein [Aeromonadaceae bacterium]MBP8064984.1 PHP domain-containing protein [Aeromonadaceae bacterium]MBP9569749.1 PHP domain-containing protein [Aeromonadaceae bacterium]